MKYLFWNTNKKDLVPQITQLLLEYRCDFVAFSEFNIRTESLLQALSQANLSYQPVEIHCDRIKVFTTLPMSWIDPLYDCSYYTLQRVRHESLGYHIVAIVHFPSKMFADRWDYLDEVRGLKATIEEKEAAESTNNTVIFGDFNMNPFEDAMVNADAFFTVPCRKVADKKIKTIRRKQYSIFYNPMWNMFGDKDGPPGSYYYSKTSIQNYYWHIFDQVLLRPSLIEHFCLDKLKILNSIDAQSIADPEGRPSVSDHFPLYFEIR